MKEYVYPAVFHHNEDDSYSVFFPDLRGCITEGKNLANAIYMAQEALALYIEYLDDNKETIPQSNLFTTYPLEKNEFINLIRIELKDNRAVKRTISLPKWMDDMAIQQKLSLSKVLQEALKDRFQKEI